MLSSKRIRDDVPETTTDNSSGVRVTWMKSYAGDEKRDEGMGVVRGYWKVWNGLGKQDQVKRRVGLVDRHGWTRVMLSHHHASDVAEVRYGTVTRLVFLLDPSSPSSLYTLMHRFRTIIVLLFAMLGPHLADAISARDDQEEATKSQVGLGVCPKLKVNCVLEGDWRHPVGSLGNRRGSDCVGVPTFGWTDRKPRSQPSASRAFDVTSATN